MAPLISEPPIHHKQPFLAVVSEKEFAFIYVQSNNKCKNFSLDKIILRRVKVGGNHSSRYRALKKMYLKKIMTPLPSWPPVQPLSVKSNTNLNGRGLRRNSALKKYLKGYGYYNPHPLS